MAETEFVTGRQIHERALSLWRQVLDAKEVVRIAAHNIKDLHIRGRLRNFGAGIPATDPALGARAVDQLDSVWMGSRCAKCQRKTC